MGGRKQRIRTRKRAERREGEGGCELRSLEEKEKQRLKECSDSTHEEADLFGFVKLFKAMTWRVLVSA